jgi:hypothetical protein
MNNKTIEHRLKMLEQGGTLCHSCHSLHLGQTSIKLSVCVTCKRSICIGCSFTLFVKEFATRPSIPKQGQHECFFCKNKKQIFPLVFLPSNKKKIKLKQQCHF